MGCIFFSQNCRSIFYIITITSSDGGVEEDCGQIQETQIRKCRDQAANNLMESMDGSMMVNYKKKNSIIICNNLICMPKIEIFCVGRRYDKKRSDSEHKR